MTTDSLLITMNLGKQTSLYELPSIDCSRSRGQFENQLQLARDARKNLRINCIQMFIGRNKDLEECLKNLSVLFT